jgi:hypothetical protein
MFCPNCNAPVHGDINECENCGAYFGEGSVWKPTLAQQGNIRRYRHQAAANQKVKPPSKTKRECSRAGMLVSRMGFSVCAVLALGAGLLGVFAAAFLFIIGAASWAK